MIGDKIIISSKDKKRAKSLIPIILKFPDKSIIAIQGVSGSQKSELMECIQDLLYEHKKRSLGISLDEYYKIHFCDRTRVRKNKGLKSVGLSEINWPLLKNIIKQFNKSAKELHLQLINKYTYSYNDLIVYESDKLNYLIIEGLYAGYLKKYFPSIYVIHLEGNPTQTLSFRKKRKKEPEHTKFRTKIVNKEYRVVSKLKPLANIILPY